MIRYGLIGFGGIAEDRIAKEGFACDRSRFAPLEGVELVGACDVNPARRAAAEALGLRWYDDVEQLLADASLDAVYIATNNLTHVPLAVQALRAGKHVAVEKPLATTVEDAQMLTDLARECGLSLTVDHMMVYNKWNVRAQGLVQAGALGVVNDSCFHMEFAYGFSPEEAATWRCNCWEELGGPIGDVASHCFYVAEFVLGDEITELAAVYLPKILEITVEDGAYIKFKTRNGLTGSVKVAFCEPRGGLGGTLSNLGFEVYGTQAVLRSYGTLFQLSGYPDEPVPMRLELDQFTSQETFLLEDVPTPNIYQCVILAHAESIRTGKRLTGDAAVRNVRQCFASHESARANGAWVAVF